MAGETIRSDGSLDEFIAALQAQAAPAPKPTATQTVMDMRRRMTGQDTPAPKMAFVPGYADGTSNVPSPPQKTAADAFAQYLAMPDAATLAAVGAAPPGSITAPLTQALVSGTGRRVAAGADAIQQGRVASGAGQIAGAVLGAGAVPVTAAIDTARPIVGGIGDFLSGMFGGGGNATVPAAATPASIASANTKTTGVPQTTVDTGEHGKNGTIDDFVAANSHLTNNQVIALLGAMPKAQNPAQQVIAQIANAHEATFQRDMAEAAKITDQAKRRDAEDKAITKKISGLTAISNTALGTIRNIGSE